MDAVLLPYLQAPDETAREEYLDELLLFHAGPVVRHRLRRKLGFNVSHTGTNSRNQDAEDLYQEVMKKTLEALSDLRTTSPGIEIDNFRQYVARIAINACNDFLREKSPALSRLRHNVRDILTRHQDFAIWEDDGKFIGGLASWSSQNRFGQDLPLRSPERDLADFQRTRFSRVDVHQVPVTKILAELLHWVGRPLRLEVLADAIARLLDLSDYANESMGEDMNAAIEMRLADSSVNADSVLEATETLAKLWRVVQGLAPNQRATFCLSFEDENGVDLFSLLLESRIVTLPQLAASLDRSVEQLVSLRSQAPMDVAAIAAELGGTRALVRQWRSRALRRIRDELLA